MRYLLQRISIENSEYSPQVAKIETLDIVDADLEMALHVVRQIAMSKSEPVMGFTMLWTQHGGTVTVGKVSTVNMEFPHYKATAEYYSITELPI